jgi:glucose-6-phosphate 1-dehydrogenase
MRWPRRTSRHYVRGQYDGYTAIDGVAADSPTETYAVLRLEIENWRWSGVPFFIRTGKRLPVTQTELRIVLKGPPRLGFGVREPHTEPDQLIIKLDPWTGVRQVINAQQADAQLPAPSSSTWSSQPKAERPRRPMRSSLLQPWRAGALGSSARRAWRRHGASCFGSSTSPGPSTPTDQAGGRDAANALTAGQGSWRGPWT